MRLGRKLVVAGIAGSAIALATPARAADVRFAGDEARITVDEAGLAHVEHALAYRVTGGLPKGFDLNGVEPEATIDPVALVTLDGEQANDGHVDRKGDRALRVTLEGAPKRSGSHATLLAVHVRYTVDLAQARELALDGAMWRLRWTAPVAPEGYDSARVFFDLPAAPTEPRVVADEGTTDDDGRVATLRRGPQRDELALERPHIAKGEAATWAARIDPRAFPRVVDPSLRPQPTAPQEPARDRAKSTWLVAAFVGLLFGAIVRAKLAAFSRACESRGVAAEGLVMTGSPSGRAWLAGGALAAAVAAQAAGLPTWGALGVVGAMVLATSRASRLAPAPRGPGHWLALSPDDAFSRRSESDVDFADLATFAGKGALLLGAVGSVALGFALRRIDPSWAWLVPLDALVLLPLVATGSRAQLPPDRARSPRRRLASIHRVLKRDSAIRVAPWARVPTGAATPDELRLLVLPRAPMPGVVGIEVGVAWIATPAGYTPETEVLVRVRDATAAAARMVALGPHRRAVHGRKTDERVVRLVPAFPSRAGAVALVGRLARELHDRRKSLPGTAMSWQGSERRLPPNERLGGAREGAGHTG